MPAILPASPPRRWVLTRRGISKGSLIVAHRSFPSPVTAMAGTAVLGLSRELRTQPVRNRSRTSRRGQAGQKNPTNSPPALQTPPLTHPSPPPNCRPTHHPHHPY